MQGAHVQHDSFAQATGTNVSSVISSVLFTIGGLPADLASEGRTRRELSCDMISMDQIRYGKGPD